MALKEPKSDQKGLKKLPRHVRNKMGYMQDGGGVEGDIAAKNSREFSTEEKANEYAKKLKEQGLHVLRNKLKNKKGNTIYGVTGIPKGGSVKDGGMIGKADMSAKKTSEPKKKKMPQYYKGGGMIKKNKPYAYGGRIAKYKD